MSQGPAVLVVDDNEDNRYTLIQRLKRQGYENVAVAENGREALDILGRQSFDLVLLDVMMPELTGDAVLQQVKADTNLRDIPVIMISAVDELDSVVKCIELGAEDYLQKPFNPVLLKARIEASLEKKRLRDQERRYFQQLQSERKRADSLLHAMLPAAAVSELKASDTVQPRRYEDVAVLFCDVVDFTAYCDSHDAEEAVGHLQVLVTAFEGVARDHGLEKIKTVGDAFMATAGLLHYVEDPALAAVRCGLQMAAAAPTLDAGWQVRVGIHIGDVVAGVIGRQNFFYDLWGDTVNTAARVVGEAAPGTVLVSGATWQYLRDHCQGRTRGFVELKGKGQVELIECTGIADEAAAG